MSVRPNDLLDAYTAGREVGVGLTIALLQEMFPNTIDDEAERFVYTELRIPYNA